MIIPGNLKGRGNSSKTIRFRRERKRLRREGSREERRLGGSLQQIQVRCRKAGHRRFSIPLMEMRTRHVNINGE